ncbi:MAG: type I methionyl aminopeptidase [Chloroflexota bacterium]
MAIIIKSPQEIEIMRQAGRIAAAALAAMVKEIRPGLRTAELDAVANREIGIGGAVPSFKGYRGFPASICVSVNNEVVHGIPGDRVLQEGDIVSLDVGAFFNGYHGDTAVTVAVGEISADARRLVEVTEGALAAAIVAARAGKRLGDVSAAIQDHAEPRGFWVVREYVGHGIGRDMHEEPQVPNFGPPGIGPLLREGMTLALEPMVNTRGWKTQVGENGWTVSTADGGLSAHFEHTIAITDGAAEILTCR